MASSDSTPDKLPNVSKIPLAGIKQETVECLSCAKNFYREKTSRFFLIACPYCGCPHYQGLLNNQQRGIFYEAVTTFLKQKQLNAKAEAEAQKNREHSLSKNLPFIYESLLSKGLPAFGMEVKDSELTSTHQAVEQKAVKSSTSEPSEDVSNQDITSAMNKGNLENSSESGITSSCFVPSWVAEYNRLFLSGQKEQAAEFAIRNNAQEVAQTETSLSQQWVGQIEGIYFEINTNSGSYWLIISQNQQMPVYHIVPNKRKFRFMESALSTMQAYFEFNHQDFDPKKVADMNKFQVIYPAEVIEVKAGQEWELKKKGLLEFEGLPGLFPKYHFSGQEKRSDPPPMPEKKHEVVKCFHCHRDFERSKTIRFAIIPCPYPDCQGPNYTGDISNSARQFKKAVLTYQSQKGMNPPPGLENLYYHQVYHHPVPVQPSPSRLPSTQKRVPSTESRNYTESVSLSSTLSSSTPSQTKKNKDIKDEDIADKDIASENNTIEDREKWIASLVEIKINEAIKRINQENQALREGIEKLQKQLQEHKRNEYIDKPADQSSQELLTRLDRLEQKLNQQQEERQHIQLLIHRYEQLSSKLTKCLDEISQIQQKHEALLDKPVAVSDVSTPEPNLIPVDMTEETVNNCFNNNREVILFESKGTGRYWVKPMQDGENDTKIYYLVCKKTVKFTLESLTLVQSCFEFENPDAPSSQVEITLPAIVSLSGTGNTWQLVKRGKLSFVNPLGES